MASISWRGAGAAGMSPAARMWGHTRAQGERLPLRREGAGGEPQLDGDGLTPI